MSIPCSPARSRTVHPGLGNQTPDPLAGLWTQMTESNRLNAGVAIQRLPTWLICGNWYACRESNAVSFLRRERPRSASKRMVRLDGFEPPYPKKLVYSQPPLSTWLKTHWCVLVFLPLGARLRITYPDRLRSRLGKGDVFPWVIDGIRTREGHTSTGSQPDA